MHIDALNSIKSFLINRIFIFESLRLIFSHKVQIKLNNYLKKKKRIFDLKFCYYMAHLHMRLFILIELLIVFFQIHFFFSQSYAIGGICTYIADILKVSADLINIQVLHTGPEDPAFEFFLGYFRILLHNVEVLNINQIS